MRKPVKSTKAERPVKQRIAQPLELSERVKLIALLNDPAMKKALGNITAVKPGVFYVGAGTDAHQAKTPEMATLIANNRMHEIRGWDMFEAALFSQTEDPRIVRERTEEDYQNQ